MATEITDNGKLSRYELHVDGKLAALLEYHLRDGRLGLVHTEVADGFDGQGIGGALVKAALADARERGLEVAPMCPFVVGYIRKHADQYMELVAPELRQRLVDRG